MAAINYKDLFKNDSEECKTLKENIIRLLEKEEDQKKAAKIISKLINQKAPK